MIGKNSPYPLSTKHQATKHQRWRVHAWQTLNVFLKTNDDVRLGDLGVPLATIFCGWDGKIPWSSGGFE